MKKILLLQTIVLIFGFQQFSFSQSYCGSIAFPEIWNFEDSVSINNQLSIEIDTNLSQTNSWHIAIPQKTVINTAFSDYNVIVTDSLNSYQINDTSIFVIKQLDYGGFSNVHSAQLAGYYNVNSDSLNDFGKIEVSLDNGVTWINLVDDPFYSTSIQWLTDKPVLTGNSNGWTYFWVSLAELGAEFPVSYEDTIMYRFTFISDSVFDNLDGLAFDDFVFCNGSEGIEELSQSNFSIYPQPFTSSFTISSRSEMTSALSYELVDVFGRKHLQGKLENQTQTIDAENLPAGIYFLKIDNGNSKVVCYKLIK